MTINVHAAPLESALFPPDLDVLRYLPWTAPADSSVVPFSSDRWDLGALDVWPAYARYTVVNWAGIRNPLWRITAKEVALCLMQPRIGIQHHLPDARRSGYPPWALSPQRLSYWRRWFAYLDDQAVRSLSRVTQGVCDGFLDTITPESRHIAVSALRVFADYRSLLTHDAYAPDFRPWGDSSAVAAAGEPRVGSNGNKTPLIPDEVFAPLLAAALFLVQVAGPDLLAAKHEVERLRSAPAQRGAPGDRRVDDALADYLERLRAEGRKLPAAAPRKNRIGGDVCRATIALNIGAKDPDVLLKPERLDAIQRAARTLGVARGGIHTEISPVVSSEGAQGARPWRGEFSLDSLAGMTNLVRTACYIVVAALSGMRSSEIAAVERNSIRREEFAPGVIRRRIQSSLLKGEPPGGRRETWVIVDEVTQAIELAEALTTNRNPLLLSAFSPLYTEFRTWVAENGGMAGLQPIPAEWNLVPRQFRRKLAREIGWRPNGVIAGKIHLKHISVATTEGYAGKHGESVAAFQAEVENERRQATAAAVERVIDAAERGEPVIGLGAASLAAAIADAGLADASDTPQVRDRDDAVRALLKARTDTLHIGPLAHCWFTDPSRARCLRGVADKTRPLVGSCEPTKCANATIHREHAPVWVGGLKSLKVSLSDRRIPAGERQRVQQKIREVETLIEPLLAQEES
ncbi:hypothetical protein [Blastococcus mobilis]|uniref:Phage integrase family protein n=1 Tax=Blastococcus mobilis TaxID=1938746 RepID=A0A238W0D1_9ACTN|nr:hypothetical protein [Blastococcus mobilis]SNR39824.1 hypothetical protein SAMN06272737_105217 [Blastococcus mobilis]